MAADAFAFKAAKTKGYFEGWYCKNVAPDGTAFSFIPGISYSSTGEGHAFVQVVRGSDGETAYARYPLSEFHASRQRFEVSVGRNSFSFHGAQISLPDTFGGIEGELAFTNCRRLASGPRQPRIMGWYRHVPFMECYHEVGSLSHEVTGSLTHSGERIDFAGGRGYLEKDWGSSMPSAWIWLQCNGFPAAEASIMLSIARIPWIGKQFTGFLGFLALPEEIDPAPRSFGTYSGAKIQEIDVDGNDVRIAIDLGDYHVRIDASRTNSGFLAAPVSGAMDRRISESIDGTVEVAVNRPDGSTVWTSKGSSAGLELVGIIDSLLPGR